MALIDVLIPTCNRKTGLAMVLTSLLGQRWTDFDVVVSDQTHEGTEYLDSVEVRTAVQALRWHGHQVTLHRHLPRRGMAEQRNAVELFGTLIAEYAVEPIGPVELLNNRTGEQQ